jgi:hypothetical protein
MFTPRIKALLGACGLLILLVGWSSFAAPRYGPHSMLDMVRMRSAEDGLVVRYSEFFATAGRCSGCHGNDTMGLAMVDAEGVDVNVVDDWRSTLMANSARDPFFRAKAEHEGLVNPAHKEEIENKCLSCHAPLGMHEQRLLGAEPFTLAMLDTSVMGLEGVSCLACHQQMPDSAGRHFSGELHFGPERHNQGENSARVYGPYADDEINAAIMTFFVGFVPGYGQHMVDGRNCAGCHTLLTGTLDLEGNPTGGKFVEQATWHEWKNSVYPQDLSTSCRGCHMPRINDAVVLASEYAFLPGHSPFGLHHLVGANTHMLRLMKERREQLGIPATDVQFDSTINRTLRMLHGGASVDVAVMDRTPDTAYVDVTLVNHAGHKFPSGYPSRRAFVRLVALDAQGDTVFQSGVWDGTNEVIGHDPGYEPHHDVIRDPDEVQIYEMVMGDVNGAVTTVLERAATALKDNRLLPLGFSTQHYAYDTTRIVGVPAADDDFGLDALGLEGSASDVVHYHIPTNGYTGPLHVKAVLYYQAMPPGWNAEMFGLHGAAIDTFRTMYMASDGTPELVAMDTLVDASVGLPDTGGAARILFPNPTTDGRFTLHAPGIREAAVFDAAGRRVPIIWQRQGGTWSGRLPDAPGAYHVLVRDDRGERLLRIVRTQP